MKTDSGKNSVANGMFSSPKEDFIASIVVFLVALPLCIGIAVAVGVSPALALITGIIGGIVVGFFAGSPLQVSGPAAGLFVIVADLLARGESGFTNGYEGPLSGDELAGAAKTHGLIVLGTSVFIAGFIQIAAGRLRLGQWFRAVSPAVIKGMLAGIGVLILASQFHVMLDHEARWNGGKAHGGLQLIATIPDAIWKCFSGGESLYQDLSGSGVTENQGDAHGHGSTGSGAADAESGNSETANTDSTNAEDSGDHAATDKKMRNHHLAALTGILTILCIVFWPLLAPGKLKVVPAALVGITVATVFASVVQLEVVKLEVPPNMFVETTLPLSGTWFAMLFSPIVIKGAIVIALVASAETLLCATAVDQLHSGVRTDYDKELTAQGVGNVLCGMVGALPMTGVIVRSSANVNAGAKTKLSTILHGFWLLIFVVALPFVLNFIPKAALGALLVYIGYKLLNFKQIRNLWNTSRSEVLIFCVTVAVIVCEDLLVGVVVGIMLSAAKLLYRFSHLEVEVLPESDGDGAAGAPVAGATASGATAMQSPVTRLQMEGAATFLRLPLLASKLEEVPDSTELHVSFEHLSYIDHACLDLLMNWAKQHEETGGKLVLDWDSLHGRFREEPREALQNQKSRASNINGGITDRRVP